MKEIRVGILGFGTVGAGVVECLHKNGGLIAQRSGVKPVIYKVADLDLETDRGVMLPDGVLTRDAAAVINDPKTDVIVELIGGTTVAKDFVIQALKAGKPVVTANKALLAEHGDEILATAEKYSGDVFYEASVAGGIPIIKAMREGLVGNRIERAVGILNGTCNYILTRMENEGIAFDTILAEAQAAGYAEADPSLDIDGIDTAHKASIMASLAYGEWFGMTPLFVEGIRGLALQDIEYAADLGYRIKLLAVLRQQEGVVQIRVHPALVAKDSMIGAVSGVFNAVWVEGDTVGDTMYYGRGAGREATASAVVADIVDVALNIKFGSGQRVPAFRAHPGHSGVMPMDDVVTRYYLRLTVKDHPGVLARVAGILGESNISIASVTQHEVSEGPVPLVILTHNAREKNLQDALKSIAALDDVMEAPVMMRIEDLD
jgi:homoserine dehydrogenase